MRFRASGGVTGLTCSNSGFDAVAKAAHKRMLGMVCSTCVSGQPLVFEVSNGRALTNKHSRLGDSKTGLAVRNLRDIGKHST